MHDLTRHLEKLRCDAAECKLISDLATDLKKRDLFSRLAHELAVLADQVEREIKARAEGAG